MDFQKTRATAFAILSFLSCAKYDKIRQGLNYLADWPNIQTKLNAAGNRSNLLSVGPFETLLPGQSLELAFAVVCARRVLEGNPASANTPAQRANLIANANSALRDGLSTRSSETHADLALLAA